MTSVRRNRSSIWRRTTISQGFKILSTTTIILERWYSFLRLYLPIYLCWIVDSNSWKILFSDLFLTFTSLNFLCYSHFGNQIRNLSLRLIIPNAICIITIIGLFHSLLSIGLLLLPYRVLPTGTNLAPSSRAGMVYRPASVTRCTSLW